MKQLMITAIIAASMAATNVATAANTLSQKYIFDDLQQVDRFSNWSIDSWTPIDRQSIIVRTSPSRAYLLILNRKLHGLKFNEAITISSTGSSIYARFDQIRVLDRHYTGIPANINRIYKLTGKGARKMVRQQILGKSA